MSSLGGNNFVSATANDASIDSTLNSIFYAYKFDNTVRDAEITKFFSKNVEFIYQYSPYLILVPQTYGSLDNVESFLSDIFRRLENTENINLHFTHYSLITEKFPAKELTIFFSFLIKKMHNSHVNIFFDIDKQYLSEAINLYQELTLKIRSVKLSSTQNLLTLV
jgi:hypothetical protein